jgi:hypothetical protein
MEDLDIVFHTTIWELVQAQRFALRLLRLLRRRAGLQASWEEVSVLPYGEPPFARGANLRPDFTDFMRNGRPFCRTRPMLRGITSV